MSRQIVTVKGKAFILVAPAELRRLERLAAKTTNSNVDQPPLPAADNAGNRPAVSFARVSIARGIIAERRALGLTQEALAKLAGIRQETLSRLESGKHSPTVRTVEKIESALRRAAKGR